VVLTLASFNTLDATVSWLSVGNVAGRLVRADISAMPHSETALQALAAWVGYQLPALSASGLRSRAQRSAHPGHRWNPQQL